MDLAVSLGKPLGRDKDTQQGRQRQKRRWTSIEGSITSIEPVPRDRCRDHFSIRLYNTSVSASTLSPRLCLSLFPADLKNEMMMIDELFVLVVVAVVVASLPQSSSSSVGALVDRDATAKAWIVTHLSQRL